MANSFNSSALDDEDELEVLILDRDGNWGAWVFNWEIEDVDWIGTVAPDLDEITENSSLNLDKTLSELNLSYHLTKNCLRTI